jgi:tetratricopeptide (TPR) repeat protein
LDYPNREGHADSAQEVRVRHLQVVIVMAIALCVYANTLPNGFVVDDNHQVVDNQWVVSPGHLPEIFSSGVWEFEARVSSYYRPFMYVLYRGTYMLFGLQPLAFHLVNVLLHAGVTVILFLLARRLWDGDTSACPWFLAPPFVAALLYAVHPIHTESVAWVAGVTDVSFAFFCLLALYLYARAGAGWGLAYALSFACFCLAMLAKEPAATLPFILLVYELLFHRGAQSWRRIALRLAPFGLALLAYGGVRAWALGGLAPTMQPVTLGPFAYALNVLILFPRYMLMLVFPVNLNFWHVFRPPESVFSTDVGTAALITSLILAVVFLMRSNRWALFASTLTVLPLLPAFYFSGLTQGIENAFAERYLYLPSAGFVLLVAAAADWCRRRIPADTSVVAVALGALVATSSIATVQRNVVWRDAYSLWSDTARKSPDSPIARLNHGYALLSRQHLDEGRAEIREALRLRPTLLENMLAKGILYGQKGLTKKAILQFHFALAAKPDFAPAHYNLAVLYESKGWLDAAIREYEATIAIQPDFADAHNNLGIAYAQKGLKEKAVEHIEAALRLRPASSEFAANLKKAQGLP